MGRSGARSAGAAEGMRAADAVATNHIIKRRSPSGMGRSRARSAGAAEGMRAADAVAAAMALACGVGFSGCHPSTCGRLSQASVCVVVQVALALACSVGISACYRTTCSVDQNCPCKSPSGADGNRGLLRRFHVNATACL